MFKKLNSLRRVSLQVDSRNIYLYSFIIGCVIGGIAILFHVCIEHLVHLFFNTYARFPLDSAASILTGHSEHSTRPFYLIVLLLPALGGLLVGFCVHFFDPAAEGSGVDHMLERFHKHGGQVRERTPFVKFLSSTLTLSSGGSVGKEGPMALIGAGIGSLSGRIIKMGARARRTLMLTGASGGLGAIFRAPLGGAITAVEVLYKEDFESDALLPCIISSVTAYTIFSAVLGFSHKLQFDVNLFHTPVELIFFVLLGLFCSGAGYIFVRMFKVFRELVFEKMPFHKILRPALGGLLIGIIGLLFPKAIGEGMGVIQLVINGDYPNNVMVASLFLLALAATKMIATSITLQSGGSGGVLIPSLFIGAMLGTLFGNICHYLFPQLVPSVTPYTVVGMAAFFSAVTNASLGALVIVTEMTGGYELLPPLMIVAVISLITSHKWSIYREQVPNKFASRAHYWDMKPVTLQNAKISDAFINQYTAKAIIKDSTSVDEIEALAESMEQTDYIIKNSLGELKGLFSLRDLSEISDEVKETRDLLVAKDLICRKLFYVTEDDSLYQALKYLMDSDFDKVPIVRKEGKSMQLLGYIQQQDIIKYYYKLASQHEKVFSHENNQSWNEHG